MANIGGKNTCEYQTVTEFSQYVINAFKEDLVTISEALNRAELVSRRVADEMHEATGTTLACKAANLKGITVDKVELNPQNFYKLCNILENNEQKELAKLMKKRCEELKGTFEVKLAGQYG